MNITGLTHRPTPEPFSPGQKKYRGPKDGLSQPAKPLLRILSNGVLKTAYRLEVEGAEKLPENGSHVYAPNHPGYLDPLVLSKVVDGDLRFMAAIENFKTVPGAKLNTWAGAFPVDRKEPHPATMQHGRDLLSEGASLGIFPEGRPPEEIGKLGAIKPGAALFAIEGEAETVVPMAIHYVEGQKATGEEKRSGWRKAAVVGTLATAGTLLGGPVGLAAGTLAGGALVGSLAGHKAARSAVKNPDVRTPFPKMIAGTIGAGLGAAAGALGAGALLGYVPALALGLAAPAALALATAGWSQANASRDVAQVRIGEPIQVEPYRQQKDRRTAVQHLTEDMHRSIGTELAHLSGIPYDDSSQKIR